jgi:hypothetical protein
MAPTAATVVLSVAAALSCVSSSAGAQQPEPTIPESFKTELHIVSDLSTSKMTQAGAGYMIIDSSAGAKGKIRNRERRSAAEPPPAAD